jgi:hypothetical protein
MFPKKGKGFPSARPVTKPEKGGPGGVGSTTGAVIGRARVLMKPDIEPAPRMTEFDLTGYRPK